jgi:hypothetical protein
MAKTVLRYDKMVEDALRGVLREALMASINGLPGGHHFYITFRTRYPGVDVAPYLQTQYPDEMTIVLQHQFWGLEVTQDWFEVTLSFNRMNERLHIPFAAVTAFADPSAKFGLQFQADTTVEAVQPAVADETQPSAESDASPAKDAPSASDEAGAQVITLDAFRKK